MQADTTSPTSALSLIAPDMREVDRVITERLATGVPLVAQVSGYIVGAGGKRLRPALLLLVSQALGFRGEDRFKLAAVVEFIHTATLLHDDVVDESKLRRGRATANAMFGNAASVLVGDFLYSRAFQMMVEANDMRVLKVLAEATNVIAEGEVMQLMNMHNADLTEGAYLDVIRSKTAKLFEACARVGAILAGANTSIEQACAIYGQALGTAFQIVDDVLDYTGDVKLLGKNLGDDLREGKTTLPMIAAKRLASPPEQAILVTAIENGDISQINTIVEIVHKTGALAVAQQAATQEARRAIAAIEPLPDNEFKACLLQLGVQLLERKA